MINELELNPSGTDSGNEWIELYNPSNYAVNVGGWKIYTTHGKTVIITISSGTILEPGEYWTYTHSKQWLDNDDERIVLKDSFNNNIDDTPTLNDDHNDDRAWARYPNGFDTDSPSNWNFQSSTKGSLND